jgi:hypothetical protein
LQLNNFKIDVIRVIDDGDKEWWWGESNEREGWFSTAFTENLKIEKPVQYYAEIAKVKDRTYQKVYSDAYRRKKKRVHNRFMK